MTTNATATRTRTLPEGGAGTVIVLAAGVLMTTCAATLVVVGAVLRQLGA
jgi:hypothetical protein